METLLKKIYHNSAEYDAEVALRRKILRTPLGLDFSKDELKNENSDIHIGAFAETTLLGCVILTPLNSTQIKMRQLAVDFDVQQKGIGQRLVGFSERWAKNLGFQEIILHARQTAVPFYLKLDYEQLGGDFLEVGIAHSKMRKKL